MKVRTTREPLRAEKGSRTPPCEYSAEIIDVNRAGVATVRNAGQDEDSHETSTDRQ